MKKTKGILALIFALIMAFSSVPFSASAHTARDGESLISAIKSFSSVQKNVKYDGSNLTKGSQVVFDTSVYTLTVNVTNVSGTKITVQAGIKGKYGDASKYKVSIYHSWNAGAETIQNGLNPSFTFDTEEVWGGTQYLKFVAYIPFDVIELTGSELYDYIDAFEDANDGSRYFEHNHYLCFGVKEKVTLSGAVDATKNSVTLTERAWEYHNEYGKDIGFSNVKAGGTVVYYKPVNASEWKTQTFKGGSLMKLTGLKPATKYTIKCKYFTTIINPENGKNVTTYSDYFNSFDIFTASAKPLKVKSIKTSKYKVTSYKRNAYYYWSGNKLVYVPEKTIKSKVYKVTVKVAKVPKNTKGIMLKVNSDVNTGRYVKYNKKKATYTFTVAEPLSKKGKKRTAKVFAVANGSSSWGIGLSPAAKKTIKIKK